MLRSVLLALVLQACAAFSGAGIASRPVQTRSASSAVVMKHNEFFSRLRKAEAGRMRLCVSR